MKGREARKPESWKAEKLGGRAAGKLEGTKAGSEKACKLEAIPGPSPSASRLRRGRLNDLLGLGAEGKVAQLLGFRCQVSGVRILIAGYWLPGCMMRDAEHWNLSADT